MFDTNGYYVNYYINLRTYEFFFQVPYEFLEVARSTGFVRVRVSRSKGRIESPPKSHLRVFRGGSIISTAYPSHRDPRIPRNSRIILQALEVAFRDPGIDYFEEEE